MTDSDHSLLPLHFSFDPGPDYVWENSSNIDLSSDISGTLTYNSNSVSSSSNGGERKESEKLDLLNAYLELVRVPLPDWLIEQTATPPSPSPPPPVASKPQLVPAKPRQECFYPDQIVNVGYTEPGYVVDVDQVDHNGRRTDYYQVEMMLFLHRLV